MRPASNHPPSGPRPAPVPAAQFALRCAAAAVLALGATASWAAAAAQDLSARLAVEVTRLARVVDAKPAADPDWKAVRPEVAAGLEQVREALRAGRVYLALERLGGARGTLRTIETAKEAVAIAAAVPAPRAAAGGGSGMAGFDAAWHRIGAGVEAADRRAHDWRWEGVPEAVRALAEAAEGSALPLLAASRSYAAATTPGDGYFYLGQAVAAAEFADFCHSLRAPAPAPAAAAPPRSVLPALARLQAQAGAAYTPARQERLHGAFINLDAALKAARELDEAGLGSGARWQYLNAVFDLATLDPTPAAAAAAGAGDDAGRLAARIAALRRRLAASHRDGSLAELFLEKAEALLPPPAAPTARAAPPPPMPPPARAQAAALVDHVVPAWFDLVTAPPAAGPPAVAAVTVTLVRWPFT